MKIINVLRLMIMFVLLSGCTTMTEIDLSKTAEWIEVTDPEELLPERIEYRDKIVYIEKPVYIPLKITGEEEIAEGENGIAGVLQDAMVVYDYASGQPYNIYTRPMEVTDIQLEPGEYLSGQMVFDDRTYWFVDYGVSLVDGNETQHIYLESAKPGEQTTLLINTDRRQYKLLLYSANGKHMESVGWNYRVSTQPATDVIPQTELSGVDPDPVQATAGTAVVVKPQYNSWPVKSEDKNPAGEDKPGSKAIAGSSDESATDKPVTNAPVTDGQSLDAFLAELRSKPASPVVNPDTTQDADRLSPKTEKDNTFFLLVVFVVCFISSLVLTRVKVLSDNKKLMASQERVPAKESKQPVSEVETIVFKPLMDKYNHDYINPVLELILPDEVAKQKAMVDATLDANMQTGLESGNKPQLDNDNDVSASLKLILPPDEAVRKVMIDTLIEGSIAHDTEERTKELVRILAAITDSKPEDLYPVKKEAVGNTAANGQGEDSLLTGKETIEQIQE